MAANRNDATRCVFGIRRRRRVFTAKLIPHQRISSTHETPQAANRVVGGVGSGRGVGCCVVGAELFLLPSSLFNDAKSRFVSAPLSTGPDRAIIWIRILHRRCL